MSEKQTLIEHAQDMTEGKACPICGNREWDVAEETYVLNAAGAGEDARVACAKCTNCGFVALFAET